MAKRGSVGGNTPTADSVPPVVGAGGAGNKKVIRSRLETDHEQQLRGIRDRLYSRTIDPTASTRHALPATPPRPKEAGQARTSFTPTLHRIDDTPLRPPVLRSVAPAPAVIHTEAPGGTIDTPPMSQKKNGIFSGHRAKILAFAGLFFFVALILSGSFIFFGQNSISANNIVIEVKAPAVISGGTELSLQVGVSNHNTVAVESATLIVEYPAGTQEVDTPSKELFRQRVDIGSIKPGEVVNIPVKAKIFGEENEEKTIAISVEYRVKGSNATFFKEADSLKLKISSSSITLEIGAIKEVSSGQDIELTLSLTSNALAPLENVLVQVEYPSGFDFSGADPQPVKGQNLWRIDALAPSSQKKITLKGVMTGGSADERTFKVSVGVASDQDRFRIASVLTTGSSGVKLTDPFAKLSVTMNGSVEKVLSLQPGGSGTVSITLKNTLSDTLYHGVVNVSLQGTGLTSDAVNPSQGFFDSKTNTISWDESQIPALRELAPGAQTQVTFSINGTHIDVSRTPEISYSVSVKGRRVSEERVPQELTNTEKRTIRFESIVSLSSYGLYSIGPFSNTGPTPPQAEVVTKYTVMLTATNGSNDLTGTTVITTLPPYVTWLGITSSGSTMVYNASTREVVWTAGDLAAHATANAAFQVGFLPSASQVGTVPALVDAQRLRGTDRFTGTVVRATSGSISANLSEDPSPNTHDGRVIQKQ